MQNSEKQTTLHSHITDLRVTNKNKIDLRRKSFKLNKCTILLAVHASKTYLKTNCIFFFSIKMRKPWQSYLSRSQNISVCSCKVVLRALTKAKCGLSYPRMRVYSDRTYLHTSTMAGKANYCHSRSPCCR